MKPRIWSVGGWWRVSVHPLKWNKRTEHEKEIWRKAYEFAAELNERRKIREFVPRQPIKGKPHIYMRWGLWRFYGALTGKGHRYFGASKFIANMNNRIYKAKQNDTRSTGEVR